MSLNSPAARLKYWEDLKGTGAATFSNPPVSFTVHFSFRTVSGVTWITVSASPPAADQGFSRRGTHERLPLCRHEQRRKRQPRHHRRPPGGGDGPAHPRLQRAAGKSPGLLSHAERRHQVIYRQAVRHLRLRGVGGHKGRWGHGAEKKARRRNGGCSHVLQWCDVVLRDLCWWIKAVSVGQYFLGWVMEYFSTRSVFFVVGIGYLVVIVLWKVGYGKGVREKRW